MQDLQRESDGGNSVVSKKLPKLGDNMDSDEEDDGEGMFYTTLDFLELRTRRTGGVFFYISNFHF